MYKCAYITKKQAKKYSYIYKLYIRISVYTQL